MSSHNRAYHPASFHEHGYADTEELRDTPPAAFPTVAPPQYTPLRFASSLDIPTIYPDFHHHATNPSPSVGSLENISPVSAPSTGGLGHKSQKRKLAEAHHASNSKRLRPDGLPTSSRPNVVSPQHNIHSDGPQGSQHNPLEIESSPEPDPRVNSSRQATHPAQPVQPRVGHYALSEADLYIQQPSRSTKKPKYYAVAGGHVPGIYTEWADVEKQIRGYSGAKQHKFGTQQEAWAYLEEHKNLVQTALNRRNGQSGGHASERDTFHGRPQSNGYIPLSPSPSSARSAQSPASQRSTTLGYHDPPPPYAYYDQSVQPVASASVAQPTMQTDSAPEPEPTLSPEQQRVVDLILQGHNVFYTGSAGCGKSTILKAFVKQLKARGKRVRIVAPTNLAALAVNGQTTWNFAGWTPDSLKKPLHKLEEASHGKEVFERFDTTDVLVIDEISMVENLLFERLNAIMKASRGAKYGGGPFGGVQIVVTGDFCQLSPVKPFQYCIGCGWELKRDNQWRPTKYECENRRCNRLDFYDMDKWAFRSKAWEECDFKHINLTEIHRQSDKKFISILQRIRTDGMILRPHADLLLNHTSETEGAIKLFSRRDDVDRVNNEKIAELPSQPLTYKCVDHFNWKEHHRGDKSLEKNTREGDHHGTLAALKEHRYEVFVQLKAGMRVVLQANLDPAAGLVNGSQGTIIEFEPYDKNRMPRKTEGGVESAPGVPVCRGAHAIYFEHQIKFFAKENKRQPWPVVKFDNGTTRTIYADCTANELGNEEPYSLLSRTQIPLMAGYAITVHKSQGMTLDRVIVNLRRAFEPSQIYVALSRARSLKGLKVEGLPQTNLGGANAQVKEFFEKYLSNK